MKIEIVSLFPPMFDALTGMGITGRAIENGLLACACGTRATTRPTRTGAWTNVRTAVGRGW